MIGVKNEPDTARSRPFQREPGVTSSMPVRPISIRSSRAARPARAIASCPKFWSTGRGKSIADVYEMSVTDAAAFTDPAIARILKRLDDVELGLPAQGLVGPQRPGEEPGPRAPTLPSGRYPAPSVPDVGSSDSSSVFDRYALRLESLYDAEGANAPTDGVTS